MLGVSVWEGGGLADRWMVVTTLFYIDYAIYSTLKRTGGAGGQGEGRETMDISLNRRGETKDAVESDSAEYKRIRRFTFVRSVRFRSGDRLH